MIPEKVKVFKIKADTCECDGFEAAYHRDAFGKLVCNKCGKPAGVIPPPEEECPACHGLGCSWCNSWGGRP